MLRDQPSHIMGMPVVIVRDVPKMQLSEGCPVTPEFRIEMNRWMREFFGYINSYPDGHTKNINGVLHMNQRTLDMITAQQRRRNGQ